MASLPSQSSWARQPARSEQASENINNDSAANDLHMQNRSAPTASDYPNPLVLNPPDQSSSQTYSQRPDPLPSPPKMEPRHCWICLQDEGEDLHMTSEWRSPCPCNLQAHEECMLEWIADLEAPSSNNNNEPVDKILCPQCKAEIKVARPHDPIVSATDAVARLSRQVVIPATVSAALGCLYSGLTIYGLNSLYLVFGAEDTARMILEPPLRSARYSLNQQQRALLKIFKLTDPFLPLISIQDWYLLFALPAIGPTLVLSRTSLADRAFTSLPILYFFFRTENRNIHWPPSPGLAFVSLPYIRLVYNGLYKRIFGTLERQWDLAVQRKPREGETAEGIAQARNQQQAENALLDIEVEIINIQENPDEPAEEDMAGDEGEAPYQEDEAIDGPAVVGHVVNDGRAPRAQIAEEVDGEQNVDGNRRPHAGNEPWEFRQNISTAQIARTVVGALFFPAISSIMGDLLKVTLPKKWVTPSTRARFGAEQVQVTSLLQVKWGRSIIGGCLFIVFKDALILYAKWRKAKNQGKRRVLDHVNRRARP